MKKVIIIVGIIVLFALAAVWVYLLTNDSDNPNGTFASPELGDTTDNTISITPDQNPQEVINLGTVTRTLQQLTTTPVVGFIELLASTSTPAAAYYAEAGTGHVYKIDLDTLEPVRVSNTTIPDVEKAIFSEDGMYMVALGTNISVVSLGASGTDTMFTISEPAEAIHIAEDTLLFTVKNGSFTEVKSYRLGSKLLAETLFTIPFTEVSVAWSPDLAGPHYFYPKPAADLMGYLYSYTEGVTKREPVSGFGLTAVAGESSVLYTSADEEYRLQSRESATKNDRTFFFRTTPHKCAPVRDSVEFVCAEPREFSSADNTSWLLGEAFTTDNFRVLNTSSGELFQPLSVEEKSSIPLDVETLTATTENILFTNKSTKDLWLYRR